MGPPLRGWRARSLLKRRRPRPANWWTWHARVRLAAAALARPVANERLQFARDFLLRRGLQPKEMEGFLAANLARFDLEQRGYQEKLRLLRKVYLTSNATRNSVRTLK